VSLHEVQQEQRRRPKKLRLEQPVAAKALLHGEDVLGFESSSGSEDDDEDAITSPPVAPVSVFTVSNDSGTVESDLDRTEAGSVSSAESSSSVKKNDDQVIVMPAENGQTGFKDRDEDLKPEDVKAADSFKEGS
jgi:hypothetical protein